MDRGYIELSGLVPPQDLLVVVRSVLGRKDNQRSRNLCTKLGLVFRCSNNGEVRRRQEFLLNFLRNDHIRSSLNSLKDRGLLISGHLSVSVRWVQCGGLTARAEGLFLSKYNFVKVWICHNLCFCIICTTHSIIVRSGHQTEGKEINSDRLFFPLNNDELVVGLAELAFATKNKTHFIRCINLTQDPRSHVIWICESGEDMSRHSRPDPLSWEATKLFLEWRDLLVCTWPIVQFKGIWPWRREHPLG